MSISLSHAKYLLKRLLIKTVLNVVYIDTSRTKCTLGVDDDYTYKLTP